MRLVFMKTIFVLFIMMWMSCLKAETLSLNIKKAEKMAVAMATVDYAHLKNRLRIKVATISEKENQVKVELGIGTVERPSKIYNCMTFKL